MDLCQRTFQNDVKKMIHSKQGSENDLRRFNFGSFQSTLMTSCVPSFKCGPLKNTCGTTSLLYSNEKNASRINDGQDVDTTNGGSACVDNISSNKRSGAKLFSNYTQGQVTTESPRKQVSSSSVTSLDILSSSDVVITQPTSSDLSSSHEFSSPVYNNTQTEAKLNNSFSALHSQERETFSSDQGSQLIIKNNSNKFLGNSSEPHNDYSDIDLPGKDLSTFTSEESVKKGPTISLASKKSIFSAIMKADANYLKNNIDHQQIPQDSKKNKESHVKTNDTYGSLHSEKNSAQSSATRHLPHDSKKSPNKKSSKVGHNAYSYSLPDATQKLFTPEDLSNEDMQPNPPNSKVEIYQNFNAKEAEFVLHKPKRKPRKVPLPSSFMVTVSLSSELQKARHGLIEPLATEDEVALQEGTKEFMENGFLSGFESSFYHSYDLSPCEAVNFVLENSIDNFDREEYVQFKKAKDSDLKVPNIPESSYLVQSLIIKPETKHIQLGITRSKMKVIHSANSADSNFKDCSLENNTNSVPNCISDRLCSEQENGNISPPGIRRVCQKNKRMTAVDDELKEGTAEKSSDSLAEDRKREKRSKKLELSSSESLKSASKRTSNDQSVLLGVSNSFSSIDPYGEDINSCKNLINISSPTNLETHKLKAGNEPSASEKTRHKRSTKLYKNIKYYKITNRDQSSFENDSSENLTKGDDVNKTFVESFKSRGRHRHRLSSNAVSAKRENPLYIYSNKETPKTTMDILEEVQSHLRARLASLEDLDALAETIADGKDTQPKGRPMVPYKPLVDLACSFTPPSSSSPSSVRDWSFSTGATRKDKRRHGRTKKRGRRECGGDDSNNASKTVYKRPSPSWSSSSLSSSSSTSSSSSSSSSAAESSSSSSSSSSDSSSSSSSSSSSIESSDIEDSLI
ncbi:serine-rich adhesin for platelets-like [Macrobrachium nipponense]|uniref:serine-rich adhesin for platelets-like n=1 Tax=Macrobrachium nipponense TaxID=159736 RepID=UPI0030C7E49A